MESDAPDGAFGFLDPSDIIRGVHLIPAFAHGTSSCYLGPSIAREFSDEELGDMDWNFFYVNMFVDRDMVIRFLGGGVGHKATNDFTDCLRPDFLSHGDGERDDEHEDDNMIGEGNSNEDGMDSEEEEEEEEEDEEEDGWEDDYFDGEDGEEPWDIRRH